jgi:SnoaL-like domain
MSTDLQALESRLRALEDWRCVYEHEIYYAHLLDTGQTRRVADDIFSPDAEVDYGTGRLQGRDAIHAFYSGFEGALLGTSHNLGNFHIEVQGDRARSVCRAMAWHWHKTPGGDSALPAADLLAIGGYQDELQRTASGWRVSRRVSVQFGTGIGVGAATDAIRPIFKGLMGRHPTWPL